MKKLFSHPTAQYQKGVVMPMVLFLLTGLVVFVVFLMFFINIRSNGMKNQDQAKFESESENFKMTAEPLDGEGQDDQMMMDETSFQYFGKLEDVSGGSSSGIVRATFDETYKMVATFEDLQEPEQGYFYEGWVVIPGSSVISSGKAEKIGGEYVNEFRSTEDLTDHTFYVLTLEPDDGDPAPAEHILEGTMSAL